MFMPAGLGEEPVQVAAELLHDHHIGDPPRAAHGAVHGCQRLPGRPDAEARLLHRALQDTPRWQGAPVLDLFLFCILLPS